MVRRTLTSGFIVMVEFKLLLFKCPIANSAPLVLNTVARYTLRTILACEYYI